MRLVMYFVMTCFVALIGLPGYALSRAENKKALKRFEKAMTAYNSHNYINAEKLVKESILIDSSYVDAFLLLSDISEELKKKEQKQYALTKIVTLQHGKYPLAHKLLADSYFNDAAYALALDHYLVFQQIAGERDADYIHQRIESCHFAKHEIEKYEQMGTKTEIVKLPSGINTSAMEYWPTVSADDSTLYFTRMLRNPGGFSYERIFKTLRDGDTWEMPEMMEIFDGELINEGTMCISADQKILFFTVCGKNDGLGSCDIYYSIKIGDQWGKPRNCGRNVNSSVWDAQPSVSADGKYLFFSSQRKGGAGGMDLWRSKMEYKTYNELRFGEAENLGALINTSGNDYSPFIHADGQTLYFASTNRVGFGGSDIYIARYGESGWDEPRNLGYPVNSNLDEDGLTISATTSTCIFSSNRVGSTNGMKDLYSFQMPSEFLPLKVGYLKGFVVDVNSSMKLDATIRLTNLKEMTEQFLTADKLNGYLTTLKAGETYALNVEKDGYLFYSEYINQDKPGTFAQAIVKNIMLSPVLIGGTITLNNIFFDFNSYLLKDESKVELERIVAFLKQNPSIHIEIAGHTDNLGNEDYNQKLSENRAGAIVAYLSTFIDKSRLTPKGYGSKFPIASNETIDGQARNRRSELVILSN